MDGDVPFWKRKRLVEMTAAEWESLCDGCGRCCLVKLEEEGTEDIYFTSVACRLLDSHGCRCRNYENRGEVVDDCVRLTPAVVDDIGWLPPTCAYKLLAEGKDLYWWHPFDFGRFQHGTRRRRVSPWSGNCARGRASRRGARKPDRRLAVTLAEARETPEAATRVMGSRPESDGPGRSGSCLVTTERLARGRKRCQMEERASGSRALRSVLQLPLAASVQARFTDAHL